MTTLREIANDELIWVITLENQHGDTLTFEEDGADGAMDKIELAIDAAFFDEVENEFKVRVHQMSRHDFRELDKESGISL
jgi:hypothetical protein